MLFLVLVNLPEKKGTAQSVFYHGKPTEELLAVQNKYKCSKHELEQIIAMSEHPYSVLVNPIRGWSTEPVKRRKMKQTLNLNNINQYTLCEEVKDFEDLDLFVNKMKENLEMYIPYKSKKNRYRLTLNGKVLTKWLSYREITEKITNKIIENKSGKLVCEKKEFTEEEVFEEVMQRIGSVFDIKKAEKKYKDAFSTGGKQVTTDPHIQIIWYHRSQAEKQALSKTDKKKVETFQKSINKIVKESNLCVLEKGGNPVIDTGAYFASHTVSPPCPSGCSSFTTSSPKKMNFTFLEFELGHPTEPKTALYFQIWLQKAATQTSPNCVHFRVHAFCKGYRSALSLPGAVFLDAYQTILDCLFVSKGSLLEEDQWHFQSELEIIDLTMYEHYNHNIFNPPQPTKKRGETRLPEAKMLRASTIGERSFFQKGQAQVNQVRFTFDNAAVNTGQILHFDDEIYFALLDWSGTNNTFWEKKMCVEYMVNRRKFVSLQKTQKAANLFGAILLSFNATGTRYPKNLVKGVLKIEKSWFSPLLQKISTLNPTYQDQVYTFISQQYNKVNPQTLKEVCTIDLNIRTFLEILTQEPLTVVSSLQAVYDKVHELESDPQNKKDSLRWRMDVLSTILYLPNFPEELFLETDEKEPLFLFLAHGVLDLGTQSVKPRLIRIIESRKKHLKNLAERQGKRKENDLPEFFLASRAVPVPQILETLNSRTDKALASTRSWQAVTKNRRVTRQFMRPQQK